MTLFCFSSNSNADYFSDDVFYSSFDFTSVNPNAKGYSGIVSDGNRYLYYVPYNNVRKKKNKHKPKTPTNIKIIFFKKTTGNAIPWKSS